MRAALVGIASPSMTLFRQRLIFVEYICPMCCLSTRQSNPHFTRSGCSALTQLESAWYERLLTDGDWRSLLQLVLSVSSLTFPRRTLEYFFAWLQLPVTGRIHALLGIEQLEWLVAVLVTPARLLILLSKIFTVSCDRSLDVPDLTMRAYSASYCRLFATDDV